MYKNIYGLYFSATNNTKDLVSRISKGIASNIENSELKFYDFTLPSAREKKLEFTCEDVVIIAMPVYAGRIPNLMLPYLNTIESSGALCIPLVSFGNRNFDDALIELASIMKKCKFELLSAAAFVYPHSFSNILASDRPSEVDYHMMDLLVESICKKINTINDKLLLANTSYRDNIESDFLDIEDIRGNTAFRDYYKPLDKEGHVFDFRKIKPYTSAQCINCKICVELCPMDSIDQENPREIIGKCIKCCACIKACPIKAKEFVDANFIKHKVELEELHDIKQVSYICD